MSSMHFALMAAGVIAPGLDSLNALRVACRSGVPPVCGVPVALPPPAALPANERRRASQTVRLVMACVEHAQAQTDHDVTSLRAVFATDEGTGEVCQLMLDALSTTRQVSPMHFPNSVQNAPSGYFSIGCRNQQPATVVSMGEESFATGLLCAVTEAAATGQPVLLAAYDPAMTSPMDELLPIREHIATVWVLGAVKPGDAAGQFGSYSIRLEPNAGKAFSPMPAWLPQAWSASSSARALSVLGLIEAVDGAACHLALGHQRMTISRVQGPR